MYKETPIAYVIENAGYETVVDAVASDGWKVRIEKDSYQSGKVLVAPLDNEDFVPGTIAVRVQDDKGRCVEETLNIEYNGYLSVWVISNSCTIVSDHSVFEIRISTNKDYSVQVHSDCSEWIELVEQNTIQTQCDSYSKVTSYIDKAVFDISENTSDKSRKGKILIINSKEEVENVIEVNQMAEGFSAILGYTMKPGSPELDFTDKTSVIASAYDQKTGEGTVILNISSIESDIFSTTHITGVEIPDGITEVGADAFSGCIFLEQVRLPETLEVINKGAFDYCQSLEHILLPESMSYIGAAAFNYCSSLTSIQIPDGVKEVGEDAFMFCRSLKDVRLPKYMEIIHEDLFFRCDSLKYIIMPDNVKEIHTRAFSHTAINEFYVPETIELLGNQVFYRCDEMCEAVLPDHLTSIPTGTFCGCESLTGFSFPNNLETIGAGAFSDCSGLTEITIPSTVKVIGKSAFSGCSSMRSVQLNDNLGYIGKCAFSDCNQLERIAVPEKITCVEDMTFMDCTSLKSISLPSDINSIGYMAFSNCSSLQDITIPASLKYLNVQAFYDCGSLKKVICLPSVPPVCMPEYAQENEPLSGLKSVSVYVSEDAYDNYVNDASWGKISDRIYCL